MYYWPLSKNSDHMMTKPGTRFHQIEAVGHSPFGKSLLSFLVFVAFLPVFCSATTVQTTRLEDKIKQIAGEGCVVLYDENDRPLFTYQEKQRLIPASIIKIHTVLEAIELLGLDYRFKTEFYQNDAGDMLIKGWGDPFLTSEELQKISQTIKASGINSVNRILIDTSAFDSQIDINGLSESLNPYDAINGALIVNFNTLNVGKDNNGNAYSAEEETPLTSLGIEKANLMAAGTKDRVSLSKSSGEAERYAVELFIEFFRISGIQVINIELGKASSNKGWTLYYTHYSSISLEHILTGLLKYSNNFIANQIFLVIGAEKKGFPATLEKARTVSVDFTKNQLDLTENDIRLVEGSGISRLNRMTGAAMMRILEKFRPYAQLLDPKKRARLKSGTLTGVYNYAGYISSPKGDRPFVIMTDHRRNYRDQLLRLLKQYSDQH